MYGLALKEKCLSRIYYYINNNYIDIAYSLIEKVKIINIKKTVIKTFIEKR